MATKTKTGYAIMSLDGTKLEKFDARMPIYWDRQVALREMRRRELSGLIVQVTLTRDE